MTRSNTLPIFLDTYEFVTQIYQTTHKFPREYKFCLGQDMNRDALNLFRLIFQANHQQNKLPYLNDFLAAFEVLRVEVRLCAELKILSNKRLACLALHMDTIGRQASAWLKYEVAQAKKKGYAQNGVCQN